ncbi:TIGR03643 family protein [Pseudoalteromonas xiamenensis]|uniref:TIGR03643 family protein n=1 Tax=Pseudoalteromonas xiamenensis TaxID=882626 RepID=A0A975DI63_9GAMM|nr:TIGR03643 family protein [Pseudoalteromonas xiamenensis]QTH72167.1 TIGR03643 family protein [Pseudoalteromonas xiamenensis]
MNYTDADLSRIIEMAWEDRTPFEAIELQFGISSTQLVKLMRSSMSEGCFKVWRQRHAGRKTKHQQLRSPHVQRGYCKTQYKHR